VTANEDFRLALHELEGDPLDAERSAWVTAWLALKADRAVVRGSLWHAPDVLDETDETDEDVFKAERIADGIYRPRTVVLINRITGARRRPNA
jgi:hypothetical protein